jgi:hypothetical protein
MPFAFDPRARRPGARISDRRGAGRSVSSDRRHHTRICVDVFANRFLNGHPYLCRITDISRTGARLVPMIEPDPSRAPRFMGLQFQLPGSSEVLTASGEMVVLDEGRSRSVGVRFTNLPPDCAWAIESFLEASGTPGSP